MGLTPAATGPAAADRIVHAVPTQAAVDLDLDLAATAVVSAPFAPAIAFEQPVGPAHPAAGVLAIPSALLHAARAFLPGGLATASLLLPDQGPGEVR